MVIECVMDNTRALLSNSVGYRLNNYFLFLCRVMKKQEEKPKVRSASKLGAFPAHIDAL